MSAKLPKIYALLVGVDLYLDNDGSRVDEQGNLITIRSLAGCMNDIGEIKRMLLEKLGLDNPHVLTSSPSSTDAKAPREDKNYTPTYENVKKYFDKVKFEGCEGDFFYFHFSGHGATLKTIPSSPEGRDCDPSLLLMDYCSGQQAIRGWELNTWLRDLHAKKIHVAVSLDSCYSGSAWRSSDNTRTPDAWTLPSNLPADRKAANVSIIGSNHRDTKLTPSWDINPEGFTLITACKSDETAKEYTVDGNVYGVFTHSMVSFLSKATTSLYTYRNVRDQVAQRIRDLGKGQTPQTYGQDRLIFLGKSEPFSPTPILVDIKEGNAVLPLGEIHGVKQNSEFTTYPKPPSSPLIVFKVFDIESLARIPKGCLPILQALKTVYWSRWSTNTTVKVQIDAAFDPTFPNLVQDEIGKRISGPVDVAIVDMMETVDTDVFTLKRQGDMVDIFSSEFSASGECPIRGVVIRSDSVEEQATKAATALAHLVRFQQVLKLRDRASVNPVPFKLTLEHVEPPGNQLSSGDKVSEHTKLRLRFDNSHDHSLFMTIMTFSPGFHIRQLYPNSEYGQEVRPNRTQSIKFNMTIPRELGSGSHRDIIRVIATTGIPLSFSSLELPDIWSSEQICHVDGRQQRHATRVLDDLEWWIEDFEIFTERP